MSNIGDLCREFSDLEIASIGRLVDMSRLLPLASDIAHAKGKIYVKNNDSTGFVLVSKADPHTSYIPGEGQKIGLLFKKYEEPLVDITFQTGKDQEGKRQWNINEVETNIQSWPIYLDNTDKVGAVLLFEWSPSFSSRESFQMLSQAAYEFFVGDLRTEEFFSTEIGTQDGLLFLNKEGKIIWANKLAEQLYGPYGVGHLVGRWYYEKILGLRNFSRVLQTMKPIEFTDKMGEHIWKLQYLPIVHENELIKIIAVIRDKTEIINKEKEIRVKETLVQEMNHRVKNNLQTIAGLLRMQSRRSGSDEVKKALNESVQRIYSMAKVHEFLAYRLEGNVKLDELVQSLLVMSGVKVQVDEKFCDKDIFLTANEASTVALILNELIQNGIDHGLDGSLGAFWEENHGNIFICVSNEVSNNDEIDFDRVDRLGLRIVKTLVEETLNGKFRNYRDNEKLYCEFSFIRGES